MDGRRTEVGGSLGVGQFGLERELVLKFLLPCLECFGLDLLQGLELPLRHRSLLSASCPSDHSRLGISCLCRPCQAGDLDPGELPWPWAPLAASGGLLGLS